MTISKTLTTDSNVQHASGTKHFSFLYLINLFFFNYLEEKGFYTFFFPLEIEHIFWSKKKN